MSRRRRRGDEHKRRYDFSALENALDKLMRNRAHVLAPEPEGLVELHWLLWPEELREQAQNVFKARPGAFYTTSYFRIRQRGVFAVSFSDLNIPRADNTGAGVQFEDIPDELQRESLQLWAMKLGRLQKDRAAMEAHIKELTPLCRTSGQLVRAWPELIGFMSEEDQFKLRQRKNRAAIPESFMVYSEEVHQVVRQRCTLPEVIEPFNDLLTEALMLPKLTKFPSISVTLD